MKYDQIDMALLAMSTDEPIVLEHEFTSDRRLIMDHILLVLGKPMKCTQSYMDYGYGSIVIVNANDDRRICGYRMHQLYFIERQFDDYAEGDTIGIDGRIESIRRNKPATEIIGVRRIGGDKDERPITMPIF